MPASGRSVVLPHGVHKVAARAEADHRAEPGRRGTDVAAVPFHAPGIAASARHRGRNWGSRARDPWSAPGPPLVRGNRRSVTSRVAWCRIASGRKKASCLAGVEDPLLVSWRPQQDSNLRTRLRSAPPKNALTSTDVACSYVRGPTAGPAWQRRRPVSRARAAPQARLGMVPEPLPRPPGAAPRCLRPTAADATGAACERRGATFVPQEMRFTISRPFPRHYLLGAFPETAAPGWRRPAARATPGRRTGCCRAGGARRP